MEHPVRICDIAAKCGLSNATVSKALNGSHEIPSSTVSIVRNAAKELGYVPNASARSLKLRRSFCIGVLFVDQTNCGLRHEYFSSMLNAVKIEAEKNGYDIAFITDNVGKNAAPSYVEHMRSRQIDGVVIASVDFSSPEVVELARSGLPIVTIDYIFNGSTAIMSDNDAGMESLVSLAYRLGHRKIAFIHGENTDVTRKRLAGFYKESAKLGLEVPQSYVLDAIYHDPDTVSKALDKLASLSEEERPTCVLFPDDISAVSTFVSAQTMKRPYLKDLSIAGYDGIELTRVTSPALTTYCQDSEMIGTLAASNLIARIEHPETFVPSQIVVKGHLQEGGTIKALTVNDRKV
jgi:LacI family transcriptional regulator